MALGQSAPAAAGRHGGGLVLGGAVVTWVGVSAVAMLLQGMAASGRPGL